MAPADLKERVLTVFDVDPAEMAPYLALGEEARPRHNYALAALVERAETILQRG